MCLSFDTAPCGLPISNYNPFYFAFYLIPLSDAAKLLWLV